MKMKTTLGLMCALGFSVGMIQTKALAADPHAHAHADAAHGAAWESVKELVAVMLPTAGNKCSGVVRFMQDGHKVKIVAELEGLSPNQLHAMHIHEFGDATSSDGTSAGGHYNPEGHDHALPEKDVRHAGDLGNVKANANGEARYEIVVENITLAGMHNPIIGRGVIVHAKPDDGGQPTGNAGGRIACGVIGIAKAK